MIPKQKKEYIDKVLSQPIIFRNKNLIKFLTIRLNLNKAQINNYIYRNYGKH